MARDSSRDRKGRSRRATRIGTSAWFLLGCVDQGQAEVGGGVVSTDPRLREATQEQLQERLDELNTPEPYDVMMELLLQAKSEAEQAEFEDVKQLQKDMAVLAEDARKAAAIDIECPKCGKPAGEPCFLEPNMDIHIGRVIQLKPKWIEEKARELRPDLFVKADKYQRMIEQEKRGSRAR